MPCAACPGSEIPPRILILKKVCRSLSDGHKMIAGMYRDISNDTTISADKAAYEEAAVSHDRMAEESMLVVVPDDMTAEEFSHG